MSSSCWFTPWHLWFRASSSSLVQHRRCVSQQGLHGLAVRWLRQQRSPRRSAEFRLSEDRRGGDPTTRMNCFWSYFARNRTLARSGTECAGLSHEVWDRTLIRSVETHSAKNPHTKVWDRTLIRSVEAQSAKNPHTKCETEPSYEMWRHRVHRTLMLSVRQNPHTKCGGTRSCAQNPSHEVWDRTLIRSVEAQSLQRTLTRSVERTRICAYNLSITKCGAHKPRSQRQIWLKLTRQLGWIG